MSGIKDLHTLLFWLDNKKRTNLEMVLSNQRHFSKEKENIIRDLEEEARSGSKSEGGPNTGPHSRRRQADQ